MFSKHLDVVLQDLSPDLRDQFDWKVGSLRKFDFPLNITTLAIEPIGGLLAAGTATGDVHIFGQPGVQSKFTLPQPVDVRLLQFSTPTSNIVCLDSNNQLHVYSLLEYGGPKLVASARFDQTISMTLSPSHCHVFLATHNGEIKTYDLTCLRKSPYTTPNLWKLYEKKLEASGMPSLSPPSPPNAVEAVIHPRNLDLMFVAYAGGVILTDLSERSTIRAYELTLPPGAPGGSGYGMDDILTHRRIMVTSIAVHPSGHFLAIGYADGSIAFWATEDDNKPLQVRTIDSIDVNIVHAELLETHLSSSGESKAPKSIPEPIFKLSWSSFAGSSDPRGGETTLAVLGGANTGHRPGLTTFLFPAFNPPEPPSDQHGSQNSLHPFFRNAMCQSLSPKKVFFYETQGIVHDYLLLPRSNPHFAGNFDPYAILLITESKTMKTVEAYEYPPPGLVPTVQAPPKTESEVESQDDASSPGLLSPQPPTPLPKSPRHLNHSPRSLRTPVVLSAGHSGILDGTLLKLHNDVYQEFVRGKIEDLHLDLKGGQAYPDTTKMNELKLSKFQPRRVLMTYNLDLTVQFFDISTQLLIPNGTTNCVEHEWPEPIPWLTIRLGDLLDDLDIVQVFSSPMDKLSIQSVQLAPETLELAILMNSGEVIVYHQASARPALSSSRNIAGDHVIMLEHCQPRSGSRLAPYFIFSPGRGPVEACALSDTGFLATSYKDGSLFVIDMRGPRIILSKNPDTKKHRHSSIIGHSHLHGHSPSPDIVQSLTWTISPLGKDPKLNVRLIAGLQSGHAEVYTLAHTGNPPSWNTSSDYAEARVMSEPVPGGIFVLDGNTGAQCKADRTRLSASLKGASENSGSRCVMISVGSKGARSSLNITGDKIGKVEWGNKHGSVRGACIIEHADSHVLVVQTDRHDALIYSLPHLEYLHTLQLPSISSLPLTIDESGDFVSWTLSSEEVHSSSVIHSATYGTFFDVRREYRIPDIDFTTGKGTVPPQPQHVPLGPTSIIGSWFTFNQSKTGEQIDAILGGPNRPIPVKTTPASTSGDAGGTVNAGGFVASAAAVQANLYNRLTSAMNERGQMLGDLEERFKSLEEGSRDMVTQAKRLAAQQSAKSWFGF